MASSFRRTPLIEVYFFIAPASPYGVVDPSELASIWKTHRPEVRRICRSILADPDEADDVADSVLVDFLFGHLEQVRHSDAVRAYLRLMAARAALHKKKRSREVRTEVRVAHEATAEEIAERTLILSRLEECADVLTPKARTVLRLRFAGDLTAEAIGELVGGSKQYIGKLLSKTFELLKECLARHRDERYKREVEQHG